MSMITLLAPAALALAALAVPARAFAPVEAPDFGPSPDRVRWQHGETQGNFLASPAWRRFATTDGRGWQARFDEGTGTPWVMWGRGIPVPTGSEAALTDALRDIFGRHADLLGVDAGALEVGAITYSSVYDTWYVAFDASREGVEAWHGGISARVKHGNLVLLTVRTAPDAPVTGARVITAAGAADLAITGGPAPDAVHTDVAVAPYLLQRHEQHGLELRQVWRVGSRTQDPPGIWVSFVDAETGALLYVENDVSYINGTIQAQHHERLLDGSPLVTSPIVDAFVDGDTNTGQTDANGDYSVNTSGTYTTDLHGDYVFVNDDSGNDGVLQSSNPDMTWTAAAATQAEIDAYVFVHQVRDWGLAVEPTITEVAYNGLDANVNINQACNAFYDGFSVNFFSAGGGCNNTGQIGDVVYHEWGHGFHLFSLFNPYDFEGSLSEGVADTVAFFNTGDHYIAPTFFTNGGAIRDVSPNHVYPQDFVNNPYFSHENGLIFGGAMWDLWQLLEADLGTAAGTDEAEQIFAGLIKGAADIPSTYFEALVADDDDGDLANGTPHQCQIGEAFGDHGLGDLAGSQFLTIHEPLSIEQEDAPIPVDVQLLAVSAGCNGVAPTTGTLHYRVNSGNWQTVAGAVNVDHVTADLPPQVLGTFVEYYLDGTDTDGNAWQAPFSGEYAPYAFFVGGVIEIGCEGFENDDGGYQHELVSGTLGDGADDWQWGAPVGQGGDPLAAFGGTNVWGNDLGLEGFNGLYQSDKVNRIWSPLIDTLHYTDVFLEYRRWLNIEDGYYDNAVITANGVEVWTNHDSGSANGGEHHEDHQWVPHAVDLRGYADQTQVELGWELHSDGGLELAGWNIDDVCLYAPLNTDNKMAILDFVVEDQGGPIALSWTNPQYAPVDRVVVTRKADGYPTAWDDGEILIDVPAPIAGERVEAVHGNVDGTSGYYAVYGFDGVGWLSWTIEGWNAGHADPNNGGTGPTGTTGQTNPTGTGAGVGDPVAGDADGDGKPDESGGCGCATGADPSGPLAPVTVVGLFGLLALRRRRTW